MPQTSKRSDNQRPRTAPASPRIAASSLDLGPLHQALPRSPLFSQQQNRSLLSSTPRQQANGQEATRALLFLQRTAATKRPSTTESGRRAPSSSPKGKGASTAEGGRIVSAPARWERPSLAESNKLFSDTPRRPGEPPALAGRARKSSGDATDSLAAQDGLPSVSRLPIDLLCQCFVRVESIYYLVNCASACRAWREVFLSDMVWKTMYLKWWQSMDRTESFDLQKKGESQALSQDTRTPPKGFDSWRNAFVSRFQEGKKQLAIQEKAWAVREGYLAIRAVADVYGKRAFDCVQGDGMQKLSEHLGLSFNISLNRGRQMKIQGKGKIDIFQSSCIVRYPVAQIGNLNLSGLKSVEVTATSDRLLRVCPIVDFVSIHTFLRDEYTQLPMATWEMVSLASQGTGPLRLLQHRIAPGVSLIVGTLMETAIDVDDIDGKEQVLLIVPSIHLNVLLWKLLDLGEGPTSHAARRLLRDDLDPHYGLHNWHVSVQFHTFGRNIWAQTFKQVFWDQRDSIPGEKAVFLLVSQPEFFPGVLKLPWKGEAFSGSLRGVYLVDITLWDGGGEIAWQHSSVARINPASLVVVEYGVDFDGEQVYTHILDNERGVNVAIDMCVPMNISFPPAKNERPMMAITNLKVGLTSKFLENWCGIANI